MALIFFSILFIISHAYNKDIIANNKNEKEYIK